MENIKSDETTSTADLPEITHQNRYLRLLADFDNYRRRVERERAAEAHLGKRGIVVSLLELLDDFDRALSHAGDACPALNEGLQAIRRKLVTLLESEGVTPFVSVGEAFDPAIHEAVGLASSQEQRPGIIVDEVRRGYRWGDDLLRPARVIVSR